MSTLEVLGAVGAVTGPVCGMVKWIVHTKARERMHERELAYRKAALSKGFVVGLASLTPLEPVPGDKKELPTQKPLDG